MSPTQRTLQGLRDLGMTAQVVERWNQHAKCRQDLFGCIDVIALSRRGILGVQCCAAASHADRVAKAAAEPRLKEWLRGKGVFQVWSWGKRCYELKTGRRSKAKRWALRITTLEVDELLDRIVEADVKR